MSGDLTVKMVLRLTRAQAKYLDEMMTAGGYGNRSELLRSIIDVLMTDDLDHPKESAGEGDDAVPPGACGLAIDMGSTKPPWGD